jgi:hypothetical protein
MLIAKIDSQKFFVRRANTQNGTERKLAPEDIQDLERRFYFSNLSDR